MHAKGVRRIFAQSIAMLVISLVAGVPAGATNASVGFSGRVVATNGDIGFGPAQAATTAIGTQAGFRVTASNPGVAPLPFRLVAYNADFSPADGITLPGPLTLAPGQVRNLVVAIPVVPGTARRLRICAEPLNGARRLCGKFIAKAVLPAR